MVLVFSLHLWVIFLSHPRFVARMDGVVWVFYSAARCPLRTALHAVAVYIHIRRVYTVCSLYLAPDEPITRDDLVALVHQLPEPFLLVGDFNIRHPSWGNRAAYPNAAMLLSVIYEFSFCCQNFGLPT